MNNKKRNILTAVLAVIFLALVFVLLNVTGIIDFDKKPVTDPEGPEDPGVIVIDEYEKYYGIFDEKKDINPDYVGDIIFESGLIDLPVVQGESNDTYLRTNWETMKYDEEGSIFMDYRNEPEDQNLILYGHYVYPSYEPSLTHMFTPLTKLKDEENYEENKNLVLVMENEIRRYEVAVVYHCLLEEEDGEYLYTREDMEYYWTNYDKDYFDSYIKTIYNEAFYDTGVSIDYNDKLLTLQTCVENHDELRLIVVCKEIDRVSY